MATITSRVLQVAITVKSAMSAIWPEGPDGLPVWAPEAREILENRLKFSCGYAAQTSELWGHPALLTFSFN